MPSKTGLRKSISIRAIMLGAIVLIVLGFALWLWRRPKTGAVATYVGQESCLPCHAGEVQAWRTSHHAKSMQQASDSTVLGNFSDRQFANASVTSKFFKNDDKFYVRTEDSEGKRHDYEISYTFGVDPLQQYLVPISNGRMQSFPVAWDSRTQERGGQRWFQLNPGQKTAPDDALHWTSRGMTWNDRCADCHSTNLQKNYDLSHDSYQTKWSSIDVSSKRVTVPAQNTSNGHKLTSKAHPRIAAASTV